MCLNASTNNENKAGGKNDFLQFHISDKVIDVDSELELIEDKPSKGKNALYCKPSVKSLFF